MQNADWGYPANYTYDKNKAYILTYDFVYHYYYYSLWANKSFLFCIFLQHTSTRKGSELSVLLCNLYHFFPFPIFLDLVHTHTLAIFNLWLWRHIIIGSVLLLPVYSSCWATHGVYFKLHLYSRGILSLLSSFPFLHSSSRNSTLPVSQLSLTHLFCLTCIHGKCKLCHWLLKRNLKSPK